MGPEHRFVSTRGKNASVSFSEALFRGLASDGGLFVPTSYPDLSDPRQLSVDYPSFAASVLSAWNIDGLDFPSLSDICDDAFSFPIRLVPLPGPYWMNCFVLELFHGPTLSFKDFGARFMGRMLSHFAEHNDRRVTILVATSGDTGSAVADAFSGEPNVRVILLFPAGQVSPIQEKQLTVARPGVTACCVLGTFDDCQAMVKAASRQYSRGKNRVSTANSINIGRLLPQSVYYSWSRRQLGEDPIFIVPSGNLGNLTGGVMAHKSGVAINGFVAAHNANSFFPDFLRDGSRNGRSSEEVGHIDLEDVTPRPSLRTLSNAMDVGMPSNLERLNTMLEPSEMRSLISGFSISDRETAETMKAVFDQTAYVADPHTAVALAAAARMRMNRTGDQPLVILSTAHPAKFVETVRGAIGRHPPVSSVLENLKNVETSVITIPALKDALSDLIESA